MNKITVAIAVITALILVGFGAWYFMSPPTTGAPEHITIGTSPFEGSLLIYIAEDQSYFAKNGLNVTIRGYDTGVNAVDGMKKGEADLSASSEYPVVGAAFRKENISVIGCIDKFQTQYILGRRDRGIENISDLNGKKIGYPRGTMAEFFLGRFIDLHGMSLGDLTLVDVNASHSVAAIADGEVDAIIYFQPYVSMMEDQLGGNAIIWPAQSNQLLFGVIAGRDDWISSHPGQVKKFIASLAQAEEYSVSHPAEAKAIVKKRLNLTEKYIATIWPDHQFSLSLDQSLLIAMNDEGRWMINNNLTTEKTMPNFRDYTYTKGLEQVNPNSVNIR